MTLTAKMFAECKSAQVLQGSHTSGDIEERCVERMMSLEKVKHNMRKCGNTDGLKWLIDKDMLGDSLYFAHCYGACCKIFVPACTY